MILGSYAFLEKKKRIGLFSFLFCLSLIYFFTLGFCFSFCSLKGEGGLADRPNHPLSREEWRLETKHFLGMASSCTRDEKDF